MAEDPGKASFGILAYGSLIANPGKEVEEITERSIENVMTPFEVEYARKSSGRHGAPTLVPVPKGKGGNVQAQIFVLTADVDEQKACDVLYRREINKVRSDKVYVDEKQRKKANGVVIDPMNGFEGFSKVFSTTLKANFEEILDDELSPQEKAEVLAKAAVESVTEETYPRNRDGIRYLADAIDNGIQTPLTEAYRLAVVASVDGAENLDQARKIVARQKGINID